uniref:NADH dehydrogenase subunit 2 n=1 Tax=Phaeocystis globosa TaxID=33658 RepID=A0A8A1RXL3_9EUKA|nr:NADH dehydrogenase subunit 2 [Phaeocystis globosa]QST19716.1 NADH dehydrogenase subunit 2 [Phaeocystis globosa]
MNCLFLCFVEFSLAIYISLAVIFSVIFASFRSYSFPSLLSIITSSSIFVFILLIFQLVDISDSSFVLLNGLSLYSPFNIFFQTLLFVFGSFILFLNRSYYSTRLLFQYEFDIIVIFSFLALSALCLSNDFLSVYVILELQSLAFYILAGFWKSSEYCNESGLRYFVIGAFSSCLLLLAFSFIYLTLGSTSFDIISTINSESFIRLHLSFFGLCLFLIALFFKLGASPSHFWVCDVYEGALINITAFFSIIPKAIIFCLLIKFVSLAFLSHGPVSSILMTISGMLSVFISSVAALYQKKTKRLLAYSAIGHVGFILLALSYGSFDSIKSVLIYIVIYMATSLGIFSILVGFSSYGFLFKYLVTWSFTKKWNIVISLSLAILLFSAAGIPPLAGFYSKFNILLLLVSEERIVLALLLVVLSCISCFFYIRLIKILFFNLFVNNIFLNRVCSKGFELPLVISTFFTIFFLIKPESLNNLFSYVTLLFIF